MSTAGYPGRRCPASSESATAAVSCSPGRPPIRGGARGAAGRRGAARARRAGGRRRGPVRDVARVAARAVRAARGVRCAGGRALGRMAEAQLRRRDGLGESAVREIGLAGGLVDNKVCAIDATWSGLRFVRRLRDRPPRPAASAAEDADERADAGDDGDHARSRTRRCGARGRPAARRPRARRRRRAASAGSRAARRRGRARSARARPPACSQRRLDVDDGAGRRSRGDERERAAHPREQRALVGERDPRIDRLRTPIHPSERPAAQGDV